MREAINNIFVSEEQHKKEKGHYISVDNFEINNTLTGILPLPNSDYFFTVKAKQNHFIVQARGKRETFVSGDTWEFNEKKQLNHVTKNGLRHCHQEEKKRMTTLTRKVIKQKSQR